MAKVELKNITKIYDKKKVIDNVSLTIEDKEFLILVGSSGCGKSTILRMIAGLEDITEGEIYIDGKCVNNIPPKDRDIAFVFQSYALYPHMSVYENLAFPLKMKKVSKEEIDKKVRETAEKLDLTELLERKPKQLSGGQRQRVALGRAIVRQPKVFLMDEPLSNLDAKLRIQMRAEIKKLHEELKTTFIYVTHDQTEALTMGDRIAIIDKGVIQQTDSPDNIYNKPKNTFVGGFLGAPAMNFIETKVEDGKIFVNDAGFNLSDAQKKLIGERKEVLLGVRAENMSVESSDFQFSAPITISEMLGSEKVVYFPANGCSCAARLSAKQNVENTMTFKVNSNDFLFFDKETKENLV